MSPFLNKPNVLCSETVFKWHRDWGKKLYDRVLFVQKSQLSYLSLIKKKDGHKHLAVHEIQGEFSEENESLPLWVMYMHTFWMDNAVPQSSSYQVRPSFALHLPPISEQWTKYLIAVISKQNT